MAKKISSSLALLAIGVGFYLYQNNFDFQKIKNNLLNHFREVETVKLDPKSEPTTLGNKQEYCGNNLYNGIYPKVHQAFDDGDLNRLCYQGYGALYKHNYRISLWVTEKLNPTREYYAQGGERESSFYPDPTLQKRYGNQAIRTENYTGTGFDRGHIAASRDMTLPTRVESYYMSNIVPQTPENNRNIWKDIEQTARCLAVNYKTDVYVVNVPFIDIDTHKRRGTSPRKINSKQGGIIVPDGMAKAIYIPSQNITGVYLTHNDSSKTHYSLMSFDELHRIAKIDPFPSLSPTEKKKISNLPDPNSYRCQSVKKG